MKYTHEQQKENRAKWVAALRSGEYEQGRGRLCRDGKYCCIGVLCHLAGMEFKSRSLPPFECGVNHWCGLSDLAGSMADGRELWEINDIDRMNFSEIADLIESEPAGLFVNPLDELTEIAKEMGDYDPSSDTTPEPTP